MVGGEEGEGAEKGLKRGLYFVGSPDSYPLHVQTWDRGKTGSLGVREIRAGTPAVLLAGSSALTEDVTTLMLLNFLNSKPGLIICLCTVVASLAKPRLVIMCMCALLPRVELACPPHPSGE